MTTRNPLNERNSMAAVVVVWRTEVGDQQLSQNGMVTLRATSDTTTTKERNSEWYSAGYRVEWIPSHLRDQRYLTSLKTIPENAGLWCRLSEIPTMMLRHCKTNWEKNFIVSIPLSAFLIMLFVWWLKHCRSMRQEDCLLSSPSLFQTFTRQHTKRNRTLAVFCVVLLTRSCRVDGKS